MSDINKKDSQYKGLSDVDLAKLAAALIGVEYPGDEYFDGSAKILPAKSSQALEEPLQEIKNEPEVVEEAVEVTSIEQTEEPIIEEQAEEILEEEISEQIEEIEEEILEETPIPVVDEPVEEEPQTIEENEVENELVTTSEGLPTVQTQPIERIRSTPFRKQSYSQWQSARLRNFAKAGIISAPDEIEEVEAEAVELKDDEIVTVDSILQEDALQLENVIEEAVPETVEESLEEVVAPEELAEEVISAEDESEEKAEEPTEIEPEIVIEEPIAEDAPETLEQTPQIEISEPTPVIPVLIPVERPAPAPKKAKAINKAPVEIKEVKALAKKNKPKSKPPVLPEFIPEKPTYFAYIEEKPQKIKRKNNAPLIIPADSEPIGFAPKGSKYREI